MSAQSPRAAGRPLRLGTRGSPLALIQAEETRRRLATAHPGVAVEIVVVRTSGDRIQDRPLAEVGGKGLFAKEIEEQLLAGTLDFAVHSLKDMETRLPGGLTLIAVLPREDPRDVLVSPVASSIAALPSGARVGTASLRRAAQVLAQRPDLRVINFRGNVETRLRRIEAGEAEATLLALAGLHRLGRRDVGHVLNEDEMLPAVGQGAIGLECRTEDSEVCALLRALNDAPTERCITAERAMLAALDGSCRTPIAGLARLTGEVLTLRGLVARADGRDMLRVERQGSAQDAAAIGREAGEDLRGRAPQNIFG